MSLKSKVINSIIAIEGGYVNDSNDSGGETKFGITKATAYAHGYQGDMKNLDRETAYQIYSKSFWDSQNLFSIEELSMVLAEEVADTGVNLGTKRAGVYLQRSLNLLNYRQKFYKDIKVDGNIGKNTIFSLKIYIEKRDREGIEILLAMLNALQGAKYIELAERREKDETFIYGWFKNRIIEPIKQILGAKKWQ